MRDKTIIGEACKSHRLLGGEVWSDLNQTVHALAADGRTLCGTRPGTEANGWFLTRVVPTRQYVDCKRCKAGMPDTGRDDRYLSEY